MEQFGEYEDDIELIINTLEKLEYKIIIQFKWSQCSSIDIQNEKK